MQLKGPILKDEPQKVLRGVSKVHGVRKKSTTTSSLTRRQTGFRRYKAVAVVASSDLNSCKRTGRRRGECCWVRPAPLWRRGE